MADNWFYTRGGKQMDPVSTAELRQLAARGLLKPTDMVWKEGMPQWVRASAAKGLFDDQPAMNGNGAERRPVESSRRSAPTRRTPVGSDDDAMAASSPRYGQSRGMGTGAKVAIVLGVIVVLSGLAVAAVMLKINSGNDDSAQLAKDKAKDKDTKDVPRTDRVIKEFKVDKLLSLREDRRELELTAGTKYELTAESEAGGRVTLYLDDSKGAELAKHKDAVGTAKLVLSPSATGKHWVEVINEADVPATIKVTVRELGKGEPGKAVDPPVVAEKDVIDSYKEFIRDLGDHKRFVEVKAGTRYEVTATSDKNCKLDIYIDDEANREVGKIVNALGVGKVTFTPAVSGRFRVEVVNMGIGDSNFSVVVRSLGADIGGPIAKVDPGFPPVPFVPALVDSYKVFIQDLKDDRRFVDLKAGVRYEITAKSDKFCKLDIYLDNEAGLEVAKHTNAPGLGKISYTPVVNGKHQIELVNMGVGDSNFSVEVRSIGAEGGIAKGDGKFPFVVDSFDVLVRDLGNVIRMYDFQLNTRYEITVTNDKGANMNLYVVNAFGLDVATDNGPAAHCFVAWTCTQAGKYKVEVSNQGIGDATAKVTIRAVGTGVAVGGPVPFPPPFPPFPDGKIGGVLPAGKLVVPTKIGTRIADALTLADMRDTVRVGSYCKVYQLNMQVGKTYTIDMMAGYDTYLRLVDAKGFQVASDDDGGEGLNARLIYRPLATGNYRIVCTTFAGGSTGNFTLIVRED